MTDIFNDRPPTGFPIYKGEKVDILILPRLVAENLNPKKPKPMILISITDPEQKEADIKNPGIFKDILRLKFHDLEYPIEGYEQCKLFDEEDAQSILDFVDEYIDEIKLIIVHCEAGVSRSAAVGAALSLIYNEDCGFFHEHYCPNGLIKSLILRTANYYNFEKEEE